MHGSLPLMCMGAISICSRFQLPLMTRTLATYFQGAGSVFTHIIFCGKCAQLYILVHEGTCVKKIQHFFVWSLDSWDSFFLDVCLTTLCRGTLVYAYYLKARPPSQSCLAVTPSSTLKMRKSHEQNWHVKTHQCFF